VRKVIDGRSFENDRMLESLGENSGSHCDEGDRPDDGGSKYL
jgi:hypothetical protein